MKINDLYNEKIEFNNMIYSIDKIRLKCYITYNQYNDLDFYIRNYFKDNIKRFYISDKISNFRYNWNIEIEEGISFWFGFCHNTEEKLPERLEPSYNLTIEFNPNKLKHNNLIMHILSLSGNWFVVRYDLAIDIRVNILDLIIDKSGKRKMHIFGKGYDDKTYEIGQEGSNNKIKIYNKKNESNLNITGSLTRIEITKVVDDFPIRDIVLWQYDNFFPDIYLNQYAYSLSDYVGRRENDKMLYCVLFAVQNGYPLNDLTRTYKKRLKDLLQGGYKIKFD